MKSIAHIFTIIFCTNLFAQEDLSDTTWHGNDWRETSKDNAKFYRVYRKTDKGFLVYDKYMTGKPQMIAEASAVKPQLIKEGNVVFYFSNGVKEKRGIFHENAKTGTWVYYYNNGTDSAVVVEGRATNPSTFTATKENGEIYTIVEQAAEFPGGITQMQKFIQTTLKYPSFCRETSIGGKVFLKFVIDEEGTITNLEILKSTGNKELDQEAINVVNAMPSWKPAMMTGKPVKCYFNLPLSFTMTDPFFVFNVSNASSNYMNAVTHINKGELLKAKELLNEEAMDDLYLLAVIDYMTKERKKACKKFSKYIERTDDKSGQKAKVANQYLEKNCS
ncbi:MAG: energy transducer TonB [Bacteroidota bacterium]|nr:energy transducer TonB [Bacteroidota bacterium]